jgi:hypothetical protein
VIEARVSSDKPLAFLCARLCDVAPDGMSGRIAHGFLNLCHRDSREAPAPMVPGEVVAIRLALDQMAWRLVPGHRLRLAVSTTCWPFVWPSPEVATVTLHEGVLCLPVRSGPAATWLPPQPEAARPWRHRVLRPGSAERKIETDLIRGTRTLLIRSDTGNAENLDHGLVSGETVEERWTIHPGDPLSARAEIRWEQRLSRGDWQVWTLAETRLTATAGKLRHEARLTASEGGRTVFERQWDEAVPRDFV